MANAHWWKVLQPNLPYATWHAEEAEMEAMLPSSATWHTAEEGRVWRFFRTLRFGRGTAQLARVGGVHTGQVAKPRRNGDHVIALVHRWDTSAEIDKIERCLYRRECERRNIYRKRWLRLGQASALEHRERAIGSFRQSNQCIAEAKGASSVLSIAGTGVKAAM